MSDRFFERGQSLLEIVFAISLFIVGVSTIGYLAINALTASERATDKTNARLLAVEGIEALLSMRDQNFATLTEGEYGLSFEEGFWALTPSFDRVGKFTRTITIENNDVDLKKITAVVTWEAVRGREMSVSYHTLLSNWTQTHGQAKGIVVDSDALSLSASSTEINGLFLKNEGSEETVITDMAITWNSPALLSSIMINGVLVFSATTSEAVVSGSIIDIEDYTLPALPGFHNVNAITFTDSIEGDNFTIILTLGDGSTRSFAVWP